MFSHVGTWERLAHRCYVHTCWLRQRISGLGEDASKGTLLMPWSKEQSLDLASSLSPMFSFKESWLPPVSQCHLQVLGDLWSDLPEEPRTFSFRALTSMKNAIKKCRNKQTYLWLCWFFVWVRCTFNKKVSLALRSFIITWPNPKESWSAQDIHPPAAPGLPFPTLL